MALKKLTFEVIKNARVTKAALKLTGRGALGAAAGAAAGGFVSHAGYKSEGAKEGAIVGAGVGALASIPAGKIAKNALKNAAVVGYGAALKAGRSVGRAPQNLEGVLTRGASDAARKGRVVFRRIRGRIVPVRMK